MTDQLQFEQRSDRLWVAELDGGASYRIEMHPGKLSSDYDLTFVDRRPSTWAPQGWNRRYSRVSQHQSLQRAVERANRDRRHRANLAGAS